MLSLGNRITSAYKRRVPHDVLGAKIVELLGPDDVTECVEISTTHRHLDIIPHTGKEPTITDFPPFYLVAPCRIRGFSGRPILANFSLAVFFICVVVGKYIMSGGGRGRVPGSLCVGGRHTVIGPYTWCTYTHTHWTPVYSIHHTHVQCTLDRRTCIRRMYVFMFNLSQH